MALAAVDWPGWKAEAAAFLRRHPRVEIRDLTRSERLVIKGAKEAFAVLHHRSAAGLRALGGLPCDLCGTWTCAFCESCSRTPRAVCTECDQSRLLCHQCLDRGLVYSEVERPAEDAAYLEVSGYHNEEGSFVSIDPPVKIPARDIPQHADGTYNIEQLMECLATGATASVDDFRYLWSSSQACFEELEHRVGRKLEHQEAMKVAVAWTNARRESVRHAEALGRSVAQERNSSVGVPTRSAPPTPAASKLPEPAAKLRRLVSSGVPAAAAPLLIEAVTHDPHAKEDAYKLSKLDTLFQLVVEHVVDLAELGVTTAQLADPGERQKFKETLMAGASRLSGQRIGALCSALRRWLRFCVAREVAPKAPTPLLLAEFLRDVSAGGPTAASSMHASLKWFAATFGAGFPMDHWATKHFRFHAVHHTGRQMPELQPWELVNLVYLMKRSHGTHGVLVAQMLMAAIGCIRFEHLQRSTFVTAHGPSLEFSCSQGKARKQGARPGYHWGLPHLTLDGQGVTQVLRDFYANEFPADSTFLLPAVALDPEEFWEVTEHTAFVTNRAMSRSRFLELLRGALFQIGVEFSQAQASGFNRLRRFLPTMANIMELPDLDLQALGNWCEIPAGGGRDPACRKGHAANLMGVHYAGSRVLRSLQVKQRCVNRFLALFQKKRRELAITDDGYLCRDSWLWPELAASHKLIPEPSGAGSSEDDSSSASDVSAEGEDIAGLLPDDTAVEDLPWFRQGKKLHVVRETVEDRPTPWCRDFPFVQEAQERGRGFAGTARTAFCESVSVVLVLVQTPNFQHCSAAARMSRIDVLQDDRGLETCFKGANLEAAWIESYTKVHKLVTLDDFIYMIQASEWEKSLLEHVEQVPDLKGNRIALARFKSAFEAGQQALKHAAQVAPKSEDLDESLPDSTIQQLNQDWSRRYSLSFDSVLEPSEQLRSRVYREFRKGTMTVVDMKKVRSVLSMAQPKASDSISLPGGLQLQLEKEVSVSLRSVTDYYFALRVLAHAWAWGGNFMVSTGPQSEKILFMDLSSALHYCDRALRDTMEYGQGSLIWLQRCDLLTRGKMATYVRRGQPAQWALDNALRDTHLEWRSPAVQPLVEVPEPRKEKRSPDGEGAPERKRQIKGDAFKTVSQVKGGQKICKPWNDGRGCKDPKCASLHCCDVRLEEGVAKPAHAAPPLGSAQRQVLSSPGATVASGPDLRQVSVSVGPGHAAPAGLAAKLRAAKPVTWRGKGDLVQVPWTPSLKGTWLVLDLWAGLSGLCIALLQMGLHFYGIAAECDAIAAEVSHKNMPHLVHVPHVEDLTAAQFVPLLQRRQFRGVIMGGGSPCQGNTSLNLQRKGLRDPRSRQPLQLQRLQSEFEALPEMQDVELVVFLENVGSMSAGVRQEYSAWLGAEPILIEAARCGWVRRRRLYWLRSRGSSISRSLQPPSCWDWAPAEGEVLELCYHGEKPLPAKCVFAQGFHPLFNAKDVVTQEGQGAMHPFTREFFHPTDRVAGSSPEAVERFMSDARRFPPSAYEDNSLLWRDDTWRQPLPAERAQMMGLPPDSLGCVPGEPSVQRQRQNSLIGNGFHIFSIMALFCLLPQLLEAKIPPALVDVAEVDLRQRLDQTVWEPGRLDHFPGLLSAPEVVARLPTLFPECVFPPCLLHDLGQRLSHCDLRQMQAFVAWCRLRGLPVDELGPLPLGRRERARIYSGTSGQRHPTDSSRGLDHLLPPGLGKSGHLAASAQLPSPFHPEDWPEPDVVFVIEAVWVWRQFLPVVASKLRHVLQTVARAVRPLEDALFTWRVESAHRVASSKRPGFVAIMTILLRWPDLLQAQCLVRGYPIVGPIAPTGVFRPVVGRDPESLDEWLADADQVVDTLVHSRPPKHAQDIFEQTLAEHEKGFCSSLQSRSAMDRLFGRGRWRPLERFQIVQADGKKRMIDNARRTEHNQHTAMTETIFTVSIDFVASVASSLVRRLYPDRRDLRAQPHAWLRFRLGTDDLPDAYRGLPVLPAHQRFSVVALYVPATGWRFTQLWGLAFGLESAVVSFNRFPLLGVSIARRCTLAFAAQYFDDELALEAVADSDLSQAGLRLVFGLMGAQPQPGKGFSPAANRHYLGSSLHVGDAAHHGFVRVQPKYATVMKVVHKLDDALVHNQLSRDEAGKLRDLVRVYTDASFEDGILRLGWVIFAPGQPPLGGTTLVPSSVVASWHPRAQQIYPGETLAAVVVPALYPDVLTNQDCIWFIDNEASAAALIRASTSESDVLVLVQQAHLQFNELNLRVWFEWVDTESNPADGLSRDGLRDPWTLSQGWQLQEFPFPPLLGPADFLQSLAQPLGAG
eukprot:s5581_g1.t1